MLPRRGPKLKASSMEQNPGGKTITKEKRREEEREPGREGGREARREVGKKEELYSSQHSDDLLLIFIYESVTKGHSKWMSPNSNHLSPSSVKHAETTMCSQGLLICYLSTGSTGYTEYPSLNSQTHLDWWWLYHQKAQKAVFPSSIDWRLWKLIHTHEQDWLGQGTHSAQHMLV